MTAFYMFRLMFMTFYGKSRVSHDVEHHIHESPKSMTVPLMVLAFAPFSPVAGLARKPGGIESLREIPGAGVCPKLTVFQAEGRSEQLAAAKARREHTNRGILPHGFFRGAAVAGLCWRGAPIATPEKGYAEPIAQAAPPVYDRSEQVLRGRSLRLPLYRPPQVGGVRLGVMGLGEASHGSIPTSSTAASTAPDG